MPGLSPYSTNRVNGKVLVSLRRPKGFHAVLTLPGICCLTDQCIAESSVVQEKAENMFSLSLPWPFLVRTRQKSRRLKQNKREQGRMIFGYFGAKQRGAHCFTGAVAVYVRDRHPHFPASPQAAATALGRALPRAGGCLPQEQARAAALGSDWEW